MTDDYGNTIEHASDAQALRCFYFIATRSAERESSAAWQALIRQFSTVDRSSVDCFRL